MFLKYSWHNVRDNLPSDVRIVLNNTVCNIIYILAHAVTTSWWFFISVMNHIYCCVLVNSEQHI